MGYSRPQPRRLAEKLLRLRMKLQLTQEQMAKEVRHRRSPVYPGHVSEFESGRREPSLLVLLRYARVGQVNIETLIDDDLDFD